MDDRDWISVMLAVWYASHQDSSFQLTKRASHLTTLNSKQPLDFQKDKTNNIKQDARLLTWWHSLTEKHPRHPKVPPQTTANHQEAKLLQAQDQRHWSLVQIILGGDSPKSSSYHALATNACQSHFLFLLSRNIDPAIHASSINGCAPADTLSSRLVILKSICGLYTPCVSTVWGFLHGISMLWLSICSQEEIYIFKFPKRFSEISWREISQFHS